MVGFQIKLMVISAVVASSISFAIAYVIFSVEIDDGSTAEGALSNTSQPSSAMSLVQSDAIGCGHDSDSVDCSLTLVSSDRSDSTALPDSAESATNELVESTVQVNDVVAESSHVRTLLLQIKDNAKAHVPENIVKLERAFYESLEQHPALLNDYANAYTQLPDSPEKEVLKSLLAGTQNITLERLAVNKITSGMDTENRHWIQLISDMGVGSAKARQQLLDYLPSIPEPNNLALVIRAISADVVSESERQHVVAALVPNLYHDNANVRGAALEKVAAWGSVEQIHHVETAMSDPDTRVRGAAISATQNSNIKSDQLKSSLLRIMNDEQENWNLRVHAFHALREFSLSGSEYGYLNQFNLYQKQRLRTNSSSNG